MVVHNKPKKNNIFTKVKDNIKSRHLNFQNEIPKLYKLLFKELFNNQEGYAGMQLREAVRNLAFYTEQELPFHYFVGFNALSKAEEKRFSRGWSARTSCSSERCSAQSSNLPAYPFSFSFSPSLGYPCFVPDVGARCLTVCPTLP